MNSVKYGAFGSVSTVFWATLALVGGLASAQHALPPKRASGTYDMTTWTPITIGSCNGDQAGCTTTMGFDWLSEGRMVLLTNDYLGHDS